MKKKILLDALDFVRKGVASKELIEQSTSFVFQKERVYTYNDEVGMSCPIPGFTIEGAVRADEFYQLVSKMPSEEIEFVVEDNTLKMRSGRARAGMVFEEQGKLPFDDMQFKGMTGNAPKGLINAIKFVAPVISLDITSPLLTCVHVCKDHAEASDGYRIATMLYKEGETLPIDDFLVPACAVSAIFPFEDDVIGVAKDEGWVHFKTKNDAILSCRIFNMDKYPDVEKFFEVKGGKILLPKEVNEIIQRAAIFCERSAKDPLAVSTITIKLKKNLMIVQSRSEVGWFKESTVIDYTRKETVFQVHPDLFVFATLVVRACTIGASSILFKGRGWKYVIALSAPEKNKE